MKIGLNLSGADDEGPIAPSRSSLPESAPSSPPDTPRTPAPTAPNPPPKFSLNTSDAGEADETAVADTEATDTAPPPAASGTTPSTGTGKTKPRPAPLGTLPTSLNSGLPRSPKTPDSGAYVQKPQPSWRRPTDLLPSHGARIGFINNHTTDILNEMTDTLWDFSGQGTVPPVPRGHVVRVDGQAEPAASVVRDALELSSMIALSRNLTVLDLTACELDSPAPGLPGRRRSAFEVLVYDGICRSGTLRVLKVSDNVLGPSAGDAVAAAMQLPSLEVFAVRGAMLGPGEVVRSRRLPEPDDVVELCCSDLAGRRGTVLPPAAFEELHKPLVAVLLHEQAPRRTVRELPQQLVSVTTSGGCSLLTRRWPEPAEPAKPLPHQKSHQFAVEYDTVQAALALGRLTELDLHCNYIGPEVGCKLLGVLESCPALEVLNLAFNQLDESCGTAVCEWLPRTGLRELDLWGNVLGQEGCQAVVDGLQLNQTIVALSLGCNGLSKESSDAIQKTFDRLRTGDDRAKLKL